MSVDIEEFDTPERHDFQRANGAPMVVNDQGKRVRLSRPSNYAKPLDDESALTNWRIDTAAFGVAHDAALQARYAAAKRDDRETIKQLREEAIKAGRGSEAADIGTALHSMSERWEQEPTFDPPSPFKESLECYENELRRLGLVSELFEYQIVNWHYGTAGTCDRLYRLTRRLVAPSGEVLPEGTLVVGDLKTGKRLDYSLPSYCVQMALYAQGEMYDVVNDATMPTPDVNQQWGILMWMPSDRAHCEAMWVDLEAGNYGAWLAQEIKDWRRKWRSGDYCAPQVPEPLGMEPEAIVEALDGKAEVLARSEADAEWLEKMTPWAQFRLDQIKGHDEAAAYLMREWPEGVATPKKGVDSVDDMRRILDVLDATERQFSLTFPEDDPRVKPGTHKSEYRVTNNPPSQQGESS